MPQVKLIVVKQSNGARNAVELGFNQPDESVQHFFQGGIEGYHF